MTSKGYVDSQDTKATAGLASEGYVNTATEGLTSKGYVDRQDTAATAGLASEGYVDTGLGTKADALPEGQTIPSKGYVDSQDAKATAGLASEGYVDRELDDKADALPTGQVIPSKGYVDSQDTKATAGLTSKGYVDRELDDKADALPSGQVIPSKGYVDSQDTKATAGLASEGYVDRQDTAATAGLASEGYVDRQDVAATEGLATEDYVEEELEGKLDIPEGDTYYVTDGELEEATKGLVEKPEDGEFITDEEVEAELNESFYRRVYEVLDNGQNHIFAEKIYPEERTIIPDQYTDQLGVGLFLHAGFFNRVNDLENDFNRLVKILIETKAYLGADGRYTARSGTTINRDNVAERVAGLYYLRNEFSSSALFRRAPDNLKDLGLKPGWRNWKEFRESDNPGLDVNMDFRLE